MNLNYTDCVSRTWELNIVVTSRMFFTLSLFTMDKYTQENNVYKKCEFLYIDSTQIYKI